MSSVLAFGTAACSAQGDEGASEPIASTTQALSDSATEQQVSVTFRVPESVPFLEAAIVAEEFSRIAERSDVWGTVAVTAGSLEVGTDAKLQSLASAGAMVVRHRTTVAGDAMSGGELTYEPTVVFGGAIEEYADFPPPVLLQLSGPVPSLSSGAVSLEPEQRLALSPGTYGAVSVKRAAVLTLSSGAYLFDSLLLDSQAVLRIDSQDGPVQSYVSGGFTHRGRIVSAGAGTPHVAILGLGSSQFTVEAPFTGALIAPQSEVRLQAAMPEGHHAVIVGKKVFIEPDTIIRSYDANWGELLGAGFDASYENADNYSMYESPLQSLVASAPSGSTGPVHAEQGVSTPVRFTLREDYPVSGGLIGNGSLTFTFSLAGSAGVTCTYRGGGASAEPSEPGDIIAGMRLYLESCSDGLPASEERSADHFELDVSPISAAPVTVRPPILQPDYCADEMELITPQQSWDMLQGFDWADAEKVADYNPDGTPTLYYAWVHVGSKEEALALKQLYIHVLGRPLFNDEFRAFAGQCGTFVNPGYGGGTFVPALIPGLTYNHLIDVLTRDDITGDRTVFDAVVIRDVPASTRNANGSVNLEVLANARFTYLDYETGAVSELERDYQLGYDDVKKDLYSAIEWMGGAAKDAGEWFMEGLAYLTSLVYGTLEVKLFLHSLTHDEAFDDVMYRGWGPNAGKPLGASGLRVAIMQEFLDMPIPTMSTGSTNVNGYVSINAVAYADMSMKGASSVCIELKTKAATVTDWFMPNELCSLRGYKTWGLEPEPPDGNEIVALHIGRVVDNYENAARLHIDNTRLMGLYQADDVYRYSKEVIGHKPPRAHILSGYWATTVSEDRDDGRKRLWAPCASTSSIGSSASTLAVAGACTLGGPVLCGGATLSAGAALVADFIFGNVDIVMSLESNLRTDRAVVSHEYGHYMFAHMADRTNDDAGDHIAWATIFGDPGEEPIELPIRYWKRTLRSRMGAVECSASLSRRARTPH